jgi:beta-mannanase
VARGAFDAVLRRQAAGFKALHKPVFVSFDHEADAKSKFLRRGTPAQYVAAWRHIVNVYRAAGATNVVWVWTVTGWKGNWTHEDQLWPGSSYVDWVSWDPYNLAGCQDGRINRNQWITFDQAVHATYVHFTTSARYGAKPLMLSEFGTVTDYGQPAKTGQWYASVPATLQHYPKIKAVTQFNKKNDCDFRVDSNSTVLSSYRSAGLKSYVNP